MSIPVVGISSLLGSGADPAYLPGDLYFLQLFPSHFRYQKDARLNQPCLSNQRHPDRHYHHPLHPLQTIRNGKCKASLCNLGSIKSLFQISMVVFNKAVIKDG